MDTLIVHVRYFIVWSCYARQKHIYDMPRNVCIVYGEEEENKNEKVYILPSVAKLGDPPYSTLWRMS